MTDHDLSGERVLVVEDEPSTRLGLTELVRTWGFTADAAVSQVTDGLTSGPSDTAAMGTENYLPSFPYLGVPYSGFAVPAS